MKTHKRKKSSRARGSKTQGWGFRQKHKGHGNKGGRGMSGAGKRGDQKKQFAKNLDPNKIYFGKQGYTSRGTAKKKYEKVNLDDIFANMFTKEGCTIDLKEHKILGDGNGFKATINAKAASAQAIEKMQKAGGKIILPEVKEEKEEPKEIKKEEKKSESKSTPKEKPVAKKAKKE